jgi:hypothetical protein
MACDIPLNPRAAAAVLMEDCDQDVAEAKRLARTRLSEPQYEELRAALWQTMIDLSIDDVWRSGRDVRKREAERGPTFMSMPVVERPPLMRAERVGDHVARDAQNNSVARPLTLTTGQTSTPSRALIGATRRVVAGLMQAEMPGGSKLEDWRKRDLRDHARRVAANASGALRWGGFLLATADLLSKDEMRVGDELVEADLQRLWRRQVSA